MSGQRSSTTGVYSNSIDWRQHVTTLPTLNEHFRANGYYVCGAGKIYHGSYPRDKDWDEYQHESRPTPTMWMAGQGQRKEERQGHE